MLLQPPVETQAAGQPHDHHRSSLPLVHQQGQPCMIWSAQLTLVSGRVPVAAARTPSATVSMAIYEEFKHTDSIVIRCMGSTCTSSVCVGYPKFLRSGAAALQHACPAQELSAIYDSGLARAALSTLAMTVLSNLLGDRLSPCPEVTCCATTQSTVCVRTPQAVHASGTWSINVHAGTLDCPMNSNFQWITVQPNFCQQIVPSGRLFIKYVRHG